MKLAAFAASFALLLSAGCASLPSLTERPEHYWLYRSARIAPTLEERLRSANRYLREVKAGPRRQQLKAWFDREEMSYYLRAFDNLPRLHAYQEALPEGPHAVEVEERITQLEARRARLENARSLGDARISDAEQQLAAADVSRRKFVAVLKAWVGRLAALKTFREPTSELSDEMIFAFRLSPPRGSCQGDACRKLLELEFQVPAEGTLTSRAALLEVKLELERGLLQSARLGGPELWTRLAEALSLRSLPSPTAAERTDALNRSALVVRSVLETALPARECEVTAAPPVVLERACRGVRLRMLAGAGPSEDDELVVVATPAP